MGDHSRDDPVLDRAHELLSNRMLSKTGAYRQAMGFPPATFGLPGGVWERNSALDIYTYRYPCGHSVAFPASGLQAGQVAPPLCPTCHLEKIDQMEAENWQRDPKWKGYSVYKDDSASVGSSRITLGSAMSWLEGEIGRVYSQAWR